MASAATQGVPGPVLTWARRALVVVDVVESVRLVRRDEAGFIERWRRFVNEVRLQVLPRHGGRLVKSLGDGLLLEFDAVSCAVAAALELQRRIDVAERGRDADAAIRLRAGVHVADVVVDELDVFGDGVNLAARLAAIGRAGDVVLSVQARDQIVCGVDAEVEDLGDCFVKNLDAPVRAFRCWSVGGARAAAGVGAPAPSRPAEPLAPRIAIVPLRCLADDPESRAVGDAVADEIIAALSKVPGLTVLSRLSTAALRDADVDVLQVARDRLRASYLLDGSCSSGGGRIRIRAQLIDLASGELVCAEVASVDERELFLGQDIAIPAITAAIGRAVVDREVARVASLPMPNLASYSLYLGGVSLLHRLSRHDFLRSQELLQHVAERAPRSAAPHAMLAKWHIFRMVQGWCDDRERQGAAARDEARRALDRDPADALSLAVDGLTSVIVDGNLDAAERSYRQALLGNAQEPYAWAFLSGVLAYRDQGDEAVQAAGRALALSPLDPSRFLFEAYLAHALIQAGRPVEAAESASESLRLNSTHMPSHRLLIIALMLAGEELPARAAAARHMQLEPGFSVRRYQARYPGREMPQAGLYADALRRAGVPD